MAPVAPPPPPVDERKQRLLEWKKQQREQQTLSSLSPARASPAEAERHERILQQRRQNMAPPSMSPVRSPPTTSTPRRPQPPPPRPGTNAGYGQRFRRQQEQRQRPRRRQQTEDLSDVASNPVSDETGSQPSTQATDTESDAPRCRGSAEFESESEDMDGQRPRSEFELSEQMPTRLYPPTAAMRQQAPARDDEFNGFVHNGTADALTDLQPRQQQDPASEDLQTQELDGHLPPPPPFVAEDEEMFLAEEANDMQRLQQQQAEGEIVEDETIDAADEELELADEEMPNASFEKLTAIAAGAKVDAEPMSAVPAEVEAAVIEPTEPAKFLHVEAPEGTRAEERLTPPESVTVAPAIQKKTGTRAIKRRRSCWSVLLVVAGLAIGSVAGGVAVCRVCPSSVVAVSLELAVKGSKKVVYPLAVEAQAVIRFQLLQLEASVRSAWVALLEHDTLEKAAKATASIVNGDVETWKEVVQSVRTTAAIVSTQLTWFAYVQLKDQLGVLAGALAQSLESIQVTWSEFLESNGLASEEKHLVISSEQFLEPLQEDQAAIRKMREQLLEQEAWALQELKRFKKRRASTATTVDSVMADTRTSVMESIYESKLMATQYVEEYTQQLAVEFMQSLEKDLEEYDLALQDAEKECGGEFVESETDGEVQLDVIFNLKRQLQQEASAFVKRQTAAESSAAESSAEDELAALKTEEERVDADRVEQEHAAVEQKRVKDARLAAERVKDERVAAERKRVEEERLVEEHKRAEEERIATERKRAKEEQIAAESKRAEEERAAAERKLAEDEEAIRLAALKEEEEARRVEADRAAALEELAMLAKLEGELQEAERLKVQAEELAQVEQAEKERLATEKTNDEARVRALEEEEKRRAAERFEAEEVERAAAAEREVERLDALKHEESEQRAQILKQEVELVRRERELEQLEQLEAEVATTQDKVSTGVNDKLVATSSWQEKLGMSSSGLPSAELVQIGAISAVFLAAVILVGYFMMRVYKGGVLRNTARRRVLSPRRKGWQRPAVSESEDSEAEEVVLLSYASPGEDDADSDSVSGDDVPEDPEEVELLSSGVELLSAQLAPEGEVAIKEEVLSDEEHKENEVEEVTMPSTQSDGNSFPQPTRFQATSYTDDDPASDSDESLMESPSVSPESSSPVQTADSSSAELSTTPPRTTAIDTPAVTPSGASDEETPDTAQRSRRWNLRSST